MSSSPYRQPYKLKHAVQSALLSLAFISTAYSSHAFAADHANIASTHQYDLAPGPLGNVLAEFAALTGTQLSFDSSMLTGLQSQGLRGSYTVDKGFSQLLKATGFGLDRIADKQYSLKKLAGIQENGQSTTLPELQVRSAREYWQDAATTEGSGSYTSGQVNIMKGTQKLKDIPLSVSVVTQQRMRDQNITSVKEALENSPGITAVASFPGTQFYSRGFFINSFQYNGVPLERQLYTRGSSFTGQTAIFDRLEIMRGPQGMLEGAGDPSGSVNLVRKRPTHEKQVVITAKVGSWDRYGLQLDAGGSLNESQTIRGRVVVDGDNQRSFVDHKASKNQTFYAALDIDLGPDTTVGLGFSHEELKSTPDVMGLPNYSNGNMPNFKRSTFLSPSWSYWDKTQDTYYADLQHRLNESWKLNISLVNAKESNDFKYIQRRGRLGPPNTFAGDAYVFDYFSNHVGGDMHISGNTELFGKKLDVVAGTNYSKLHSDDVWGAKYGVESLSNILNYQASVAEPTDAEIYASNRWDDAYESTSRGIYATGRYQLTDPLSLVLGARASSYKNIYSSDGPWGASVAEASKNDKVTPFTALIYKLSDEWSVYASYTDIFKPQNRRDVTGSFLDPIIGKGYEIGLKGELLNGKVNTALTLFHMTQKNMGLQDASIATNIAQAQCGGTCYRSAMEIKSQGVEAEISGELAQRLQVYAAYTFNDIQYVSEEPPSVAYNITANVGVPKHMLRLWSTYTLPGDWNKLSISGGVTSQSEASSFGYYARQQSGYTVFNGRIAYRLDEHLLASLNITNLFDKNYFESTSYDHNYYGTPRSVVLTLRYQF